VAGGQVRCGKILLCISEDWFVLSHFVPLIKTLRGISDELVVATRSSGRISEIEELGARVVEFNFQRASLNPARQFHTVRKLVRLIQNERPDVIHSVAMQPVVLSSLALKFVSVPHAMLHITGLGFLGISQTAAARVIRPLGLAVIRSIVRRPTTWIFAENPDDLAFVTGARMDAQTGEQPSEPRQSVLGGAGIDTIAFPAYPVPENDVPVAAFAGRMIKSKGIDVLLEAADELRARGVPLYIDLYGRTDPDNPEAISAKVLNARCREADITWHGHVADIGEVWRRSDIAILPSISREGMPRAVLEAAAAARPLVITDVAGSRHFARDDVEGLVVPPGDASALADALARLASDPELRLRLGAAARRRLLAGYTIADVQAGILNAYTALLSDNMEH